MALWTPVSSCMRQDIQWFPSPCRMMGKSYLPADSQTLQIKAFPISLESTMLVQQHKISPSTERPLRGCEEAPVRKFGEQLSNRQQTAQIGCFLVRERGWPMAGN